MRGVRIGADRKLSGVRQEALLIITKAMLYITGVYSVCDKLVHNEFPYNTDRMFDSH